MLRGYFFFILCIFASYSHADDLGGRGDMLARAETGGESAVRLANKNNSDRSSVQYILSASGAKLPVHFMPQNDVSKVTFVFVGGLDSDIDTFTEVEQILLPLGYGAVRLELLGQGELISKNGPNIDPLALSSQTRDLIAVLDQLKIDKNKIVLVGYSYGAAVAIEAATQMKVTTLNLINPLVPSNLDNATFASIFMRLKNISGPAPINYRDPRDLLIYLSTLGEYTNQDAESFNLNEVTSAYDLFIGVPADTAGALSLVTNRVNIFDGLSDLVVASSDKSNLFDRVLPIRRGVYYRADGVTHRAPEESAAEVVKFLTETNP